MNKEIIPKLHKENGRNRTIFIYMLANLNSGKTYEQTKQELREFYGGLI